MWRYNTRTACVVWYANVPRLYEIVPKIERDGCQKSDLRPAEQRGNLQLRDPPRIGAPRLTSVAAGAPVFPTEAGALHSGLTMGIERRLLPEELAMLELAPVRTTSIKKIRDSHHALARALASGMSNIEASRVTGFDSGYISILKADPAFEELLAFYAEHDAVEQANLRERMTLIALDVSQEIRDRLHNEPETFPIGELRQLLVNLADRVGFGPSSTVHQTVDITEQLSYADQRALADALKELDKRAASEATQVIEHQAAGALPAQAADVIPPSANTHAHESPEGGLTTAPSPELVPDALLKELTRGG